MTRMARYAATVLIPAAIIAVDQAIKAWATAVLMPVKTMPLIPGIVELSYVLNDGAAFSSLSGRQGLLIAVTAAALLGLVWYLLFRTPESNLEYAAWLLVLGGGIGNLIDRVANRMVVDYINLLFMRFAVFNFADICICTGVGLFILAMLLDELKRKKQDGAEV